MEKRLIYALKCPVTNEVHYIGKSTQGFTRPMRHLKSSHSEKVKQWVSELKELNLTVDVEVLEYVPMNIGIDSRERYWVQYYINKGALLLNSNLITPETFGDINEYLNPTHNVFRKQLSEFLKAKRKMLSITQEELSYKSGISLRVIRKIEQLIADLRLSSVINILNLFGYTLKISKVNKS